MIKNSRKRLRLENFDYSANTSYFVTICTFNRNHTLSHIVGDGSSVPINTIYGKIVDDYINKISIHYDSVVINKYIIMPNHIHIIISLQYNLLGTENPSPTQNRCEPTIPKIIAWFKYQTTKEINDLYNKQIQKIWQRSYHDHIIRNKYDYEKIWTYIDTNPLKWELDCYYN